MPGSGKGRFGPVDLDGALGFFGRAEWAIDAIGLLDDAFSGAILARLNQEKLFYNQSDVGFTGTGQPDREPARGQVACRCHPRPVGVNRPETGYADRQLCRLPLAF
ncbi:MAG: hypothetical protein R3E95_00265 [Thiolinea sp.]